MKRFLLSLALLSCGMGLMAQEQHTKEHDEPSLYERISNLERKNEHFKLYMNMNGSFDSQWNSLQPGDHYSHFKMHQLRIEAMGNINERFFYRWRQRLNSPNNPGMDNLPASIDIAMLGAHLDDKFTLLMGKQWVAYGGIEYDLNPIEVYEYSDMIEHISGFMTGVNLMYQATPTQQFQLQILNGLNNSFEQTYHLSYNPEAAKSKLPLLYTFLWHGSFFDNAYQTRWSASLLSETKKDNMMYFAFGNQMNFSKYFDMYLDVMYSREDIDRKGIISSMISSGKTGGDNLPNAEYFSLVSKANFRFAPSWNFFVKGMYETASVSKKESLLGLTPGQYRTSYGYMGGLEYYPIKNSNLHFFLTYVGRKFNHNEELVKLPDYTTNRVSLGFIYQMRMF